jgi:hypothetical protein
MFRYIFKPNYENYEGVRPINIYLLRFFYFLMAIFVATDAWKGILTHEGAWDHHRAMNTCVWAAYATLAVFGLINPLRWLPIFVFMIFYKTLWLVVVALPLWRAGALAGSPAAEMAGVYFAAPFLALIVPWKYFFQNFILKARYNL